MNESDKQQNHAASSRQSAPQPSAATETVEAAGTAGASTDVATSSQQAPASTPSADEAAAAPSPESEENPELLQTREQLEAARRRIDELARAYQALTQDREDFKARLTRERERLIDVEKGNVAVALLETVDELELSLSAAKGDESPLAKGIRMIRDGLVQRLQGLGVERIPVVDRTYDPNTAEAFDMEITANPEHDQLVVAEIRGGYRLKERVIRPARVKVAKYVKPADA